MVAELIVAVGTMGSGKDYYCNSLVTEGYQHINFADEVREFAWDILGWEPRDDKEYARFKDNYTLTLNQHIDNGIFRLPIHHLTGRELLQHIGTELMRKRDPDYWVNFWYEKTMQALVLGGKVCCSDARFPNEIRKILDNFKNFKFIFCNYNSDRRHDDNPHISELLSQELLKMGYKHREEISIKDLYTVLFKVENIIEEKLKCKK